MAAAADRQLIIQRELRAALKMLNVYVLLYVSCDAEFGFYSRKHVY